MSSSRIGTNSSVLCALAEPDVNLALWRRSLPAPLLDGLSRWSTSNPTGFDATLDAASYDLADLAPQLDGWPARLLQADVGWLVGHFLAIARAARFRLAFACVKGDQCRKFHSDYLRLRLLVTYCGPGTEWLPESAVDRGALEHGVPAPELIQRAHTGDVLLLKGSDACAHPAVHRSPPIAGSSVTRVVLTISAYGDS